MNICTTEHLSRFTTLLSVHRVTKFNINLPKIRRLSIKLKTLKGDISGYCHNSCPSRNTASVWRLKNYSVKNTTYVLADGKVDLEKFTGNDFRVALS